ncbi:hypothetical protein [Alkalicoccus chagannorensis]|uniref:hypothetical protein n=1 Tax=Alkalicoccus chagannorensis TaxID=427072 RepID=UPI0004122D03|nr:hypothetical protein [Alkalicoccus chagannorensis]
MTSRKLHPVLIVVLGLAAVGILFSLVQNPVGFITGIFVTIGVVTLLLLLFRKFIQPKLMQRQSGFEVPVKNGRPQPQKQKQRKPARRTNTQLKPVKQEKKAPKPLVKKQSDVKLTVIEGKKNMKKKSRALF